MHQPPIRKECPPGACTCAREQLADAPAHALRILLLTKEEEKKLVARIEGLRSLAELRHLAARMHEQLGIVLRVAPGSSEVRTVRGISITLDEQPGLCRKTRQAVPAAVRRCLERNPEIVYAILNEQGLLRDA
ncbi:MAG TPA: hypothetical protein VIM12_03225 [Noviherbaspirillum sp.]|jgi:hypothetical protein|uniref:hypothetical protein n=1 Tax=Noviherbaspirillum sp. TaxID=1926288 RepID=UPI002F936954